MPARNASELPGNGRAAEPDILFVTRKWTPAMGGMETYALRLTEALAAHAPVEIVALPGQADGMPPTTLALLGFPFTVLRRWLARNASPHVLHIADMALWPVGLLAGRGTRVVLSAHGTDVAYQRRGGWRGRLYGAYLRLGARFLWRATVIANSHATKAVAGESGWDKCQVVPPATDLKGDAPDGSHTSRILFAGRLVPRKGCGWFVREVLPHLPPGIELDVAGTVWNESERAALADPKVRFLGSLAGDALARAYREALCVIVPNIEPGNGEYEGFGLVAAEAAAAGGIVLAADHGGLRDAVIDGETGQLVDVGNPEKWRDAVLDIAGWDADARRRFLARSIERATGHFNWDRVARDVLAAYGEPGAARQA